MAEELKIIIEADVSQAQQALSGIQDAASKTATSLKNVAPAANSALAATAQQAKVVQLSVSSLGRTIDDLKQKVAGKQALISTERDVINIARLNKEIQALQAEIQRVQNIGKSGFNALGQASTEATDKLVSGFGNAFSAIRRLAFILPGIGIAGIFDAAFNGLQKLADAISSTNLGVDKFKELTNAIEESKDEFVKASVTVASLKDEIQLAKDGFISKDEVVKHYNETIGKTTGLVNDINQAEQALNKNAEAYIRFTLDKAAANVALGKSAELAFQAALQNQKDLERISKITADKEGIGEFIKSGEDNLRKAEQESFQKRIASLNDIADNFLKEAATIAKQFNFNFFDDNKKDKVVRGLDEIQRKIIELGTEAQKIFNVPLKLRFDSDDLNVDKFRKAQEILKEIEDHTIRLNIIVPDKIELPKIQPEIDKPFFKKQLDDFVKGLTTDLSVRLQTKTLLEQFDALKQKLSDSFAFDPKNITKSLSDAAKLILDDTELQNALKLSLTLDADPTKFAESINEIKQFLPKELQTTLDIALQVGDIKTIGLEQSIAKMNEDINKALESGLENISTEGLAGIGDAIGAALSGGDIGNAFKQFGTALGSAVEALGKQIIALGVAALLTKKSLSVLFANPALAIAAGIALVAIGEAMKQLLGGGLQGFEKGGRPPVGEWVIVGERGPELMKFDQPGRVFSNSESQRMMSSVSSSSVKEHGTIREYIIASKVAQQLKEHFSYAFRSIENTIKTVTASHDKLISYSYKLHESVTSLKEVIASDKTNNNFYKDSIASISTTIQKIIEKPSDNITSKETVATIVKGDNESSHYENSFERLEKVIVKNLTSTGTVSNKFTDHFLTEKIASSFKELHLTSAKAIDRLHESVTNNLTSSIDKLHEKINNSDRSVTIERIINNNFFSSDSFKETFKSMSLTDLQKTFHIPAFAQGGAVFGPTLAILGEGFGISRGNPEFVGTRSQLSGIQGGQFDVNVNVDGELSFDMGKLAIALNRNQRSSFRTSGKPGF